MSNPYSSPSSSDVTQQAVAGQFVRSIQIITIAMCLGVLVFMGIALMVQQGKLDAEPDMLSWFAIGFAVVLYVNHLAFPRIIQAAQLKNISPGRIRNADEAARWDLLVPVYRTQHIVACALLEGAAFMNQIAYFVTPFFGNLIAAAVLIILIAIKFPTATRLQFWVQDRARELERS